MDHLQDNHDTLKTLNTLSGLSKHRWAPLEDPNFPFADFDFLTCLEQSDCVGERTGWFPFFFVLESQGTIKEVMINYLKNNSYGEYIFDWQWADAFAHHNIPYYPKFVAAIPFTPATGPKILHGQENNPPKILGALKPLVAESPASSAHFLYLSENEIPWFAEGDWILRDSMQYHWVNQGYQNFADFLTSLSGKKRRQIQRERRHLEGEGVVFNWLTGDDLREESGRRFYQFYRTTIDKKCSIPYLTEEFFARICETMKDRVVICAASLNGSIIGASLSFFKGQNLYGRYWGATHPMRYLHFELCYYQLIDFAIERGFKLFEAGAQGDHKLARGFDPVKTRSAHYIKHRAFAKAIATYVEEESLSVNQVVRHQKEHGAYRKK